MAAQLIRLFSTRSGIHYIKQEKLNDIGINWHLEKQTEVMAKEYLFSKEHM